MKVCELCVGRVEVGAPEESVREGALRMLGRGVGSLVIVDHLQRPLGIVTDRDLMARCVVEGRDAGRTRLGDVMSGPVAWVHESRELPEAVEEMARLRVRRLAVVDDRERLVGILALDDVLLARLTPESPEVRALRATM